MNIEDLNLKEIKLDWTEEFQKEYPLSLLESEFYPHTLIEGLSCELYYTKCTKESISTKDDRESTFFLCGIEKFDGENIKVKYPVGNQANLLAVTMMLNGGKFDVSVPGADYEDDDFINNLATFELKFEKI